MSCCPVSLTPLHELRLAVVFRGSADGGVYDAHSIVRWLQTSRRNPLTNQPVAAGASFSEVLAPIRLPHMSEADVVATERFLLQSAREEDGCSVLLVLMIVLNVHWLILALSCMAEPAEQRFKCLTQPLTFYLVQLGGCLLLPSRRPLACWDPMPQLLWLVGVCFGLWMSSGCRWLASNSI
jgi:hypothetical protein